MRFLSPTDRRFPIRYLIPLAALVLLGALAFAGCSKKPTAPYGTTGSTGGGGGGTGGTTESFDSGLFSSGEFVHTFANSGDFGYHCVLHGTPTSGMRGTVHVVAGAADSPSVAVGSNFYNPATVSVKPGGYVKWVASGSTHSVTTP